MLEREVRKMGDDFVKMLQYVGETFVTDARNQKTFKDQTGNLRSSIGYCILRDGVIIEQDIKGSAEGEAAAVKAVQDIPQKPGIRLVVVAGMEYASYVESLGLNVITVQGDQAVVNLDRLFKKYAKSKKIKI